MISLVLSPLFIKTRSVILLNQSSLRTPIESTLSRLKKNPFDPMLRSKKVYSQKYGTKWSSVVKNDLRIIWDFYGSSGDKIQVLTIGTNKEPLKAYSN
jgi:mRNA-degrading endonuclease YafQ of YafQ-DinJ toxin-antitoxin module